MRLIFARCSLKIIECDHFFTSITLAILFNAAVASVNTSSSADFLFFLFLGFTICGVTGSSSSVSYKKINIAIPMYVLTYRTTIDQYVL